MQKLIGCILILLSTTAGGFLYGVEQQQYLEKLMYIRHILELIQGEIEYSGAPLFEVFGKTANRVQEPYRSWMLDHVVFLNLGYDELLQLFLVIV